MLFVRRLSVSSEAQNHTDGIEVECEAVRWSLCGLLCAASRHSVFQIGHFLHEPTWIFSAGFCQDWVSEAIGVWVCR